MAMGRKDKRPYTLLLVGALVVLLLLLAILQYRWLSQVGMGERETMRVSLRTRANTFREDLNREIGRVNSTLEKWAFALHNKAWADFAERYDQWQATPYPGLIKDFFFIDSGKDGQLRLLRFDKTSRRFEPVDWPANFEYLRRWLERQAVENEERARKRQTAENEERARKRLLEIGSLPERGFSLSERASIADEVPALIQKIE
jgi:hypothetical protein